jgi:hypothetical protein
MDAGVDKLHRSVFGHVEDHHLQSILERLHNLRLG